MKPVDRHDVVIVGGGFAGIAASATLARRGIEHIVLERGDDVGGTWRDNVYPGCRCDVPSHLYSFSFAPNPGWTHTYSYQSEIQEYLRRVARDHGVVGRTRFGTDVLDARWDSEDRAWHLTTTTGELLADVLVLGNGPLAEPALPDIPGIEDFRGATFHSARWDVDHDLTGERVGVVGTGASAVQLVPAVQRRAQHLTVFQRTPPWVLPHRNRPITARERRAYRLVPPLQKLNRLGVYLARELVGVALLRNGRGVRFIEGGARKHLATQVPDEDLRRRLTPDYRAGCKRLLFSSTWYPALVEDNVDVVSEKILKVVPEGIVTADGTVHELDTIVFGTGFHVTDNPMAARVRGRAGATLADRFAVEGRRAYLGTTVPGFPNLFLMAGPNTGIGHTSLILMIEAQLRYVVDALRTMRRERLATVEVREEPFEAWNAELQAKLAGTVWNAGGCSSYYLDDAGRNTSIWPGLVHQFVRRTRRFVPADHTTTPMAGRAAS